MIDSKPARQDDVGYWRKLLGDLVLQKKLFWILTILILLADLWSKSAAINLVLEQGNGRYYWIFRPWFALVEVYNKGGPWGMGGEFPEGLRIFRLLALGFILYILRGTPPRNRFQVVSLALVMGGALGNIWDTLFYKKGGEVVGAVRDFLYFDLGFPPANPWPAFNLADSMICVGVACLILGFVLGGIQAQRKAKAGAGDEPAQRG
jgi:signal peptidase II